MKRADAEILTVDDLAELFACDKETAAARLTSGDLPGVKVGRGWIIPRQALFERLNEKAREESAKRREQFSAAIQKAQQHTKSPQTESANNISTHTTLLLPKEKSIKIGRARRVPPKLPPVGSSEITY